MGFRLDRRLYTSYWEVAFFSLMVGVGETYLAAYSMVLGVKEAGAGILTVYPILFGSFLQLASPWIEPLFKSRQHWVVACASVQALSLFILAAIGVSPIPTHMITILLMLIATMYWGSALAAGPAWNAWIGNIVPTELRVRFFSERTAVAQVLTLVGLVLAGIALQQMPDPYKRQTFVTMLALAGIFRVMSCILLSRQRYGLWPTVWALSLNVLLT